MHNFSVQCSINLIFVHMDILWPKFWLLKQYSDTAFLRIGQDGMIMAKSLWADGNCRNLSIKLLANFYLVSSSVKLKKSLRSQRDQKIQTWCINQELSIKTSGHRFVWFALLTQCPYKFGKWGQIYAICLRKSQSTLSTLKDWYHSQGTMCISLATLVYA